MNGHEVNIMPKNIYDVVCSAFVYYAMPWALVSHNSFGSPSNGFMGKGDFFGTGGRTPTKAGLLSTIFSNL